MKTLKTIIFTIIILSFTSCDKVIDLKLNNSDPKIVIQGNINDQPGPYNVIITKSVRFDEADNFPHVTGAIVNISDDAGNSETLSETEPGTYTTSSIQGTPGRTYRLTVTVDGTTYTATSQMSNAVNIENVYIDKDFWGSESLVAITFTDPFAIKNYYNLVFFINTVRQKVFNTIDDEPYKGKIIEYYLTPENMLYEFKAGDEVTVWLESIDKGIYDYFRTVENQDESSASPSNPISNISNGALGYFKACSVSKATLIVQ